MTKESKPARRSLRVVEQKEAQRFLREVPSKKREKEVRSMLREAKEDVKQHKKRYKLVKAEGGDTTEAKKDLQKASFHYRSKKRIGKQVRKAGKLERRSSFSSRLKAQAKARAAQNLAETASENDEFQEVTQIYYHYQEAKVATQRARSVGRLAKSTGRRVLDVGRRFKQNRLPSQKKDSPLNKRMREQLRRVQQEAVRRAYQAIQEVVKAFGQVVQLVVANPLVSSLVAGGVLLAIAVLAAMSPSISIQDEYDLNGTYLYLTKQDRDKSNDKVEYWTNWEEPLLYINYKYDDIHDKLNLNEYGIMTDNHSGAQYARSLWEGLNKDPEKLKSMKDLYKDKDSRFYLDKEDQEEFEELLENGKEVGRFFTLQELENPFYGLEDPISDQSIKIAKRMGYVEKDKVSNETTLQVNANHDLLAVMNGTIRIKDREVTIETIDTRFTYKNVYGLRVRDGDQVTSGQLLGKTNPSGNQVITYEKELDYVPDPTITNRKPKIEKKWVYVNPGFYFNSVTYLQETYLISQDIDADKAQRVIFMYNYFKQHVPGTTVKGVSALSGNFDVESGINPKRAESDYMPPPVGATATSWDDPAWLSMSGPQIYAGRYPNILRRGLGLGQWTDTADGSVRHTMLLDYARSKGKPWYDLELQLDFMLHGDSPVYRERLKAVLTGSGTTDELTNQFLILWEGNPGNKLMARQVSARQWEIYLNGILSGGTTGVASQSIPAEYRDKLVYGLPNAQSITQGQGYPGNAYALGNCTWYVYNRFYQIGTIIYPYLGNAGYWHSSAQGRGYQVSTTPKVGTAVVFAPGVAGSHPEYGHVGFVEYVNSDGSFLVSEMNFKGLYQLSWRVLHYQPGMYFVDPR